MVKKWNRPSREGSFPSPAPALPPPPSALLRQIGRNFDSGSVFFVMSTTLISSGDEASVAAAAVAVEVEFASCDCCGLTEECTLAYIAVVRERHVGRWICGLCAEAVQDEIRRSELLISTEEAMGRHATFCQSFRPAEEPSVDPAEQLIAAVKHLLRRSLESPRAVRSTPSSPRTGGGLSRPRSNLVRTGSGFPELLG